MVVAKYGSERLYKDIESLAQLKFLYKRDQGSHGDWKTLKMKKSYGKAMESE